MKRTIAILPLLLTAAACHREAPAPAKTITPVHIAPVDLYQPKGGGRYSASILPARQVTLTFRVPGIVEGLYEVDGRRLEPGDMVPAGTVLARLRQDDYRNSVAQAQSQLETAREQHRTVAAQLAQYQAGRAKAEADFGRAKTLIESQSLTQPEFDAAKAQLDSTAAQVSAARAQVDVVMAQVRTAEAAFATAKLGQRDSALVAPFAASVVQRNIEIGTLAGATQAAYTLADISTVKAVFGVPDTVVVHLRRGRRIALNVEALAGEQFEGTVSAIASVADPETRLFQVEVTLANPRLQLKPGMIASLSLDEPAASPAVPVIPLSAVIRDRDNPSGFSVMVVENRVAKVRRVNLGDTFGDVLAVTSGLKPGEMVIRAGATLVNDGQTVEVLP